jgi:hypothetical protein
MDMGDHARPSMPDTTHRLKGPGVDQYGVRVAPTPLWLNPGAALARRGVWRVRGSGRDLPGCDRPRDGGASEELRDSPG